MANRKILYTGTDGSIRELPTGSGTYYDDAGNGTLYAKSITFNSMSFNRDGIIVMTTGSASVLGPATEFDVLAWDAPNKGWKYVKGNTIDVTAPALTASSNADISGTLDNPYPKSLRNVTTGSLKISNGGTGLFSGSSKNDFAGLTGEYILTGSSTGKFGFLAASQATSAVALVSNGAGWDYITQSVNNLAEVSVYNTPNIYSWTASAGTKAIRVLVQGGGGGGGSGANRNSGVSALGGAGGAAGAFVDSGIFTINDSFSAQIIVGSGGLGGVYPQTNSAGFTGSDGGSSSFGSYFYANGGSGGRSGSINSSVTSSGGSSVTSSRNIYDNFVYNRSFVLNNSDSGSNNSTTAGLSNIFTTASLYYDAGGGASGGSLAASNYTTNYNGGNAGSAFINSGSAAGILNASSAISSSITSSIDSSIIFPSNIFLASGGGGGASAKVTETFNSGTLALAHFNLSNPTKDNSAYNNSILSGSSVGIQIISSGSISALSGGFSDGILSSSQWASPAGTAPSLYFSPGYAIGTGNNFCIESWFYLLNTGTTAVDSYLMGANYTGSQGCLLQITSSAKLRIWTPTLSPTSSNAVPLNQWSHIILQKSGSNLQVFINATQSLTTASNPNMTYPFFGYGLANQAGLNYGNYGFNGYAKEFRLLNRALSPAEITSSYQDRINNISGEYSNINIQSYPGGSGSNGAWGSGGGGGGASTNLTGSTVGTQQGGNGGDGYVAVISYKY